MLEHNIIFYTTHCPLCKGLEKALNTKHIQYTTCTDVQTMKNLGITRVPVLAVDGELLSYKQALQWTLTQEQ
jgi:glutaredoxin